MPGADLLAFLHFAHRAALPRRLETTRPSSGETMRIFSAFVSAWFHAFFGAFPLNLEDADVRHIGLMAQIEGPPQLRRLARASSSDQPILLRGDAGHASRP